MLSRLSAGVRRPSQMPSRPARPFELRPSVWEEAPTAKEVVVIRPHTYTVAPRVPDRLKELQRIAMNFWWTWDGEAIDLFRRLEPKAFLWERCYGNPSACWAWSPRTA